MWSVESVVECVLWNVDCVVECREYCGVSRVLWSVEYVSGVR